MILEIIGCAEAELNHFFSATSGMCAKGSVVFEPFIGLAI
jgi:hypothetical protein